MAKTLCYSNHNLSKTKFTYHAWDTETDGLGGPLQCITSYTDYDSQNPSRLFTGPNSPAEFLSYALELAPYSRNNPNVWVSHNLSYDLRYLIAYALDHREDYWFATMGLRTDTDFYCFEIFDRGTKALARFVDSLAVFPRSLKDFAGQFAPEHCKLGGPDFDKGERFDLNNPEHLDYARRDAEALYYAIKNYALTIEKDYGVTLGYTAAGTALKAWQKTIPDHLAYFRQSKKPREFLRRGYYGGLVFLTDTNAHANAVTFDINSSYPAQMRKGVPAGKAKHTHKYYTPEQYPGFYECEVTTPNDLIVPILPFRNDKGILNWRRGTFSGVYTNLEIEFARANGYIIKTGQGFLFDGLCFPFEDFINQCETIRTQAKKTPRETVAKLMQNSVYGKFGTKEERRVLFLVEDDIDLEDLRDSKPLNPDDPDNPFWVRTEDQSEEMLNKVEWAAWITANARLTLLSTIYALGPEHCLYGDTDSITVKSCADFSVIPVSDKYGDYKKEKVWQQFRAIAPKCYCGIIKNQTTGKSKGQRSRSMKEKDWQALFDSGLVEIETYQLPSIMQSLKHGVKEANNLLKKSSDLLNSSSYRMLDCGLVIPKDASAGGCL